MVASMLAFLNQVLALLSSPAVVAVLGTGGIAEVVLRIVSAFIPGDKVYSLFHGAAAIVNVAAQILSDVGKILDNLTPQLSK